MAQARAKQSPQLMQRALRLALSVVAAHLTGACTGNDVCILIADPVIKVQVRDAVTDEPIAGPIRGIGTDGVFQDSLVAMTFLDDPTTSVTTLGGGYERAGTYAVHLEAAGYQAWDTTGVGVFDDGCHLDATSFTARLRRVEATSLRVRRH